MEKVLNEFFEAFSLGIPVIDKWICDGYYEDYDWNKSEEDCSGYLKANKMTVEELNQKIQKEINRAIDKRSSSYNPRIGAVVTPLGMVSGAHIKYPDLFTEDILTLVYLLNKKGNLILPRYKNLKNFKNGILKKCMKLKDNVMLRKEVRELFLDDSRR